MTNCREKAIFAASLSGRQAMKQLIVINTETANKCQVGSGGSLRAPPCFGAPSPLPHSSSFWGTLGGGTIVESHRLVFGWLIVTKRKLSCWISPPGFSGVFTFPASGGERQTHPHPPLLFVPTVALISVHASGRLHVQVHRVMGRVGL